MQNPSGRDVGARIRSFLPITQAEAVYYADQLQIRTYKREIMEIVYDLSQKANSQILLDPLAKPDGLFGADTYVFGNSEATAYAARLSFQPPNAERMLIDSLFTAIKTVGISKFDAFYLCCMANNEADTLLNLISTSYPMVNTAATFTAGRGFLGNGTTSVLDIAFNPSTAGGAMTQNLAHIATVNLLASANSLQDIGVTDGTRLSFILLDGSIMASRLNTGTTTNLGSSLSNRQGHWVLNRSTSTAMQGYRNGSSIGSTNGNTSTGLPNSTMKVLNFVSNFSTQEIAFAHFGASLTSGQISSLYTDGILPILTYKSLP